MQIGVAKAGRSVPEKKSLSASELSSLVAAWRQKRPLPQRVTWSSLLADFEKTDSEQGWLLSLASSPERQQALLNFLNQAEEEEKKIASDAIRNAILDEILEFSLGLAANPTVARFSFSMDGTKLEALAKLIGSDSVSDEIEEALLAFDRQVEERESRLQARLAWKPSAPQRRVSQNVSSRSYDPGAPSILTGRLNDAPEMLGQKLSHERARQLVLQLESVFYGVKGASRLSRPPVAEVTPRNTYFAQGLEPRVQFGELSGAPGVEGYLKNPPATGPRVLEFPLQDGEFVYLMFDGHHRAAAQMLRGDRAFEGVTVMTLADAETEYGLSEADILDAIRDLHTHLYMTEAPVPK